jgi:hypothetical protein
MNKIYFILLGIAFLFSSCTVHFGLTSNSNIHSTEVVLSKKNFKVVDSVQGTSQAVYVFGIGGISKNAMIAEARANMLSKVDFIGTSKAVINETVEVKYTLFPFFREYLVTVSAHIIEFTE